MFVAYSTKADKFRWAGLNLDGPDQKPKFINSITDYHFEIFQFCNKMYLSISVKLGGPEVKSGDHGPWSSANTMPVVT